MSNDIQPGDTVRLKSGGPLMTVSELRDEGTALTQWFDDRQELKSATFVLTSLVKDEGSSGLLS